MILVWPWVILTLVNYHLLYFIDRGLEGKLLAYNMPVEIWEKIDWDDPPLLSNVAKPLSTFWPTLVTSGNMVDIRSAICCREQFRQNPTPTFAHAWMLVEIFCPNCPSPKTLLFACIDYPKFGWCTQIDHQLLLACSIINPLLVIDG